jgi:hypothetical protein
MKMDPRVQTLIDNARYAHTPAWYLHKDVSEADSPWCCGCEGTVLYKDCPVMAVADALEEEYAE